MALDPSPSSSSSSSLPLTASYQLSPPSSAPSAVSSSSSVWQSCQTGDVAYLSAFLSSPSGGSELNLVNALFETPLHVAASHNQLRCVQLLLRHRPQLNLQDRESGWTALHRACYRGHLAVACALVQAGADPTVHDRDGLTAFDLLNTRGTPACFVQVERARAGDEDEEEAADELAARSRLPAKERRRRQRLDEDELRARKESTWRSSLMHLLYALGSNSNLQLGLSSDATTHKPRLLSALAEHDVVAVATTRLASFSLSSAGLLHAWGQGSLYRLGTGEERSEIVPRLIPTKGRMVALDADDRYGAAVGEKGEVLIWGTVDFLGSERALKRERDRERDERRERDEADKAMKAMSLADRADFLQQRETERREREEEERERERERAKQPRKDECVFPTPHRLDSCRHLRVAQLSSSQHRLFLLTHSGELWYIGQSLEDGALTAVPRRVQSMVELTVSAVRSSRSSVVVLSREGDVYQQLKGERKSGRVMFKFSTFSTFSSSSHTPSSSYSSLSPPLSGSSSPPFSPNSPPFSPTSLPPSATSSGRKRPSAYPRIVKIAVTSSAERAIAVTSHGECYWWKILQQDEGVQQVSSTTSPPLPPASLTHSYSIPPFYLPASAPGAFTASSSASVGSSSRNRRTAYLVAGLSSLRVVDVAMGNGHTTVVTDAGDVWHWGNRALLPASAKPQRVHYLHQATAVWCSDQHVLVSTVFHKPAAAVFPPAISDSVPTLRSLCEQQMCAHVDLSSLLSALSFAIALSLPTLLCYAMSYLLLNLNILVHPAMKRLSCDDWTVIERFYAAEVIRLDEAGDGGAEGVDGGADAEEDERCVVRELQAERKAVDDGEETSATEERKGESNTEEDGDSDSDVEGGEDEGGVVNLLAQAQHAKASAQRKERRKERRRAERLQELEREVLQRRRDEEEHWRVGLSSAEIVSKLRSQQRALKKKLRRQPCFDVATREVWVKLERIKAEARSMVEAGCPEAAQLLDDSNPQPHPSPEPAVEVEDEKEKAGQAGKKENVGNVEVKLSELDVDRKETDRKDVETERTLSQPRAWGRSMVTAAAVPSSTQPSPPLSLFAMIQLEQEQAATAAAASRTPTGKSADARSRPTPTSSPTPSSTASVSPTSTPPSTSSPVSASSRSLLSNPWRTTPPSSAAVPGGAALLGGTTSPPRHLSLAEIQQEEESAQQLRRTKSPAVAAPSQPLLRSSSPPILTSSPFKLQLADFIPARAVKPAPPAPAKAWKVSSNASPPSSSLREIQDEERERECKQFALPGAAIPGKAAGAGTVGSVVWGRADVVRGAAVKGVVRLTEAMEEEERKREEERLLKAVEDAQERERHAEQRRRKQEESRKRQHDTQQRRGRAALPSSAVDDGAAVAAPGRGGNARGGRGGRGRGGAAAVPGRGGDAQGQRRQVYRRKQVGAVDDGKHSVDGAVSNERRIELAG